jgi:hypothetical protein
VTIRSASPTNDVYGRFCWKPQQGNPLYRGILVAGYTRELEGFCRALVCFLQVHDLQVQWRTCGFYLFQRRFGHLSSLQFSLAGLTAGLFRFTAFCTEIGLCAREDVYGSVYRQMMNAAVLLLLIACVIISDQHLKCTEMIGDDRALAVFALRWGARATNPHLKVEFPSLDSIILAS